MWELYDSLIAEIPAERMAANVLVGDCWTVVTADDGTVGAAMTTHLSTMPPLRTDYAGISLRELAGCIKSWNLIEAGIGMAAINAWYNSAQRMDALHAAQGDARYCTFDIPVEGKRIVKVGHIRHRHEVFEKAASVVTLERDPVDGEYPDSACECIIPESDIVLITGSAFINKTMPRLLEIARGKIVIIAGPSTPMAPQLFSFGVSRLAGMTVSDREGMLRFVGMRTRGTPYRFGTRFCLSNI